MTFDEFFDFNQFGESAYAVWNLMMNLVSGLAGTTPEVFSGEAWYYVTQQITPLTMALGASCLNIFFVVSMVRQSTNMKENYTLEMIVENCILLVLANMLLINGKNLVRLLFQMAAKGADLFLQGGLDFSPNDADLGTTLFVNMFFMIFYIVSLVCGGMIAYAFYRRYLMLYLLVAVMPVALSTIPGGRGVNNTASAWIRTFLASCFDVTVMALALSIGAMMCNGIDFGAAAEGIGTLFDGALQMLQSMLTMILLAGAVTGVDMFMRRALAL